MAANCIQQQLLADPAQQTHKMKCSARARQVENCDIFCGSAAVTYFEIGSDFTDPKPMVRADRLTDRHQDKQGGPFPCKPRAFQHRHLGRFGITQVVADAVIEMRE